jgi:ribosomal protein L37AE/L43A
MEKEFNITWCKSDSEYPKTNAVCPKCNTGTIYTSKFGGVYCNQCKYKWKPSKFGVKKEEPKNIGIELLMEEVVSGFKKLNERVDRLVEYVVKNIPEKK